MAKHEPKIPILDIGKREFDNREVNVLFPLTSYWVGYGFIGCIKNPIRRRFLQARSENGICVYYLWTTPDKGKEYMFVSYFKKRVKISPEKANNHYETIQKQ